ncbi:O-antigen ligase family protein [Parerythrobacter jejuensis]|uniref:O-antigen ligase-related domain-containing protein n=1 Tax=Parerythrobacter jejuensis TaxID=795812 RepID=A0A845AWD9_9SPHN|nr:O-antigen ligase family protein [Parerythrobacter jejuensis]MXP31108.1 hypothetical protein [Parerythrobacter jejuensis]MXP33868.1 hypothetical protein [Parerythrobacter jejuensis]
MTETDSASRDGFFPATALLLAVLVLAGGTARAANDLLGLLSALPLLYLLLRGVRAQDLDWPARLALALYGLAWLQLVPVPPAIWTALPGRQLAVDILATMGMAPGWRPLALDPGSAAIGLVSIAAPLVLLVGFARLTRQEQSKLLLGIVIIAIATAILGVVQRVTGGLNIYDADHAGYATGLFANRNHHASFLACAILIVPAVVPSTRQKWGLWIVAGIALGLFAGILATTSRAGIVLGAGALGASLVAAAQPRKAVLLAGGAVMIVAGAALALTPALAPVFERFADAAQDQRATMARDTLVAAQAFWPWGSGWGSFVPVYMAFEDLDTMAGRYVVAAHNDYLQLILEGGIFGLVVAIAGPLASALVAARLWRDKAPGPLWCLWGVGLVLLLHSAVDFPLRTGALAALLAIAFAAKENWQAPLPARARAD